VTDNDCPVCSGTGFEVGYHPALPLQCWDLSPESVDERVDNELKGSTREGAYITARVIGFPALNDRDVWVNGSTDERWRIDKIQVAAAIRNVPLIYNVTMGLLPFNNSMYAIEIGGEPADRDPRPVVAFEGCGDIVIDHNYGGADYLSYKDAAGNSVEGAAVYIFNKSDVDAAIPGLPARNLAVAKTTTTTNGRWAIALYLYAGDYGVLFEKPGKYGPDLQLITVTVPGAQPYVWANLPLGQADDDPTTPTVNEEEILATETGADGVVTEQKEKIPKPNPDDDFWAV
jgi:hypothetical protein